MIVEQLAGKERVLEVGIKQVTVRMEKTLAKKLSYVASYQGRSVNRLMVLLARKVVQSFEEAHGPIQGTIRPEENVKPGRNQKDEK